MKYILPIMLICSMSVSSCSVINYAAQQMESGKVWCNERYLSKDKRNFSVTAMNVARKGYIYSTLGAITLQNNSYDSRSHLFKLPNNIKEVFSDDKFSGFQAKTFIIYHEGTDRPKELVISFAGTNQFRDWVTNAQVSKKQFKQAIDYYNKSIKNKDIGDVNDLSKIVVTGYSLGGALATYVGKNEDMKGKVIEIWVFNPSPYSHTDYKKENNFWFGAAKNDILKKVREKQKGYYMGMFEENHIYDNQYLIGTKSNIYAHSRWVVARNMLWTADDSYVKEGNYNNPAYAIIQNSEFKSCQSK